jgi:ferredoxin
VSVSKFKTHRYMNVTGPIKNLYGTVPGTTKFVYHSRFNDEKEFADLIVDVHLAAGPSVHVLDAVQVTEGEGSRHGTPRNMGCIAAGRNAFALESLVMYLAGLEASDNKVLSAAIDRGICKRGMGWFETLGDEAGDLRLHGFVLPESNFFSERVPAVLTGRLSRLVAATPEPVKGACSRCGKCVDFCPRGAMSLGPEVAVVDKKKCIRCFCCDELCEQQAIEIKKPLLARILKR